MRISDWSSYGCSSDLLEVVVLTKADGRDFALPLEIGVGQLNFVAGEIGLELVGEGTGGGTFDSDTATAKLVAEAKLVGRNAIARVGHIGEIILRSEESRVGKECVMTCRSRWSPSHLKKKQITISNK